MSPSGEIRSSQLVYLLYAGAFILSIAVLLLVEVRKVYKRYRSGGAAGIVAYLLDIWTYCSLSVLLCGVLCIVLFIQLTSTFSALTKEFAKEGGNTHIHGFLNVRSMLTSFEAAYGHANSFRDLTPGIKT